MADIGIATLAMTQGVSSAMFFLPKITDVRRVSSRDAESVRDIRTGEVAMIVTTFGIGGMLSFMTKSPLPAGIALFTALLIVGLYESVLVQEPGISATVVPMRGN